MDDRELVATASCVLDECGLGDLIWGHVSCRDRHGRGTWIKASGFGLEETSPDHVVLIGRDGTLLQGEGGVPIEHPIHTEILAARADVGCVVHCHAPHAIALAATGEPLRPISHEGTLFTPPDIVRFTETADLIRTPGLGGMLADRLGARNAALMVSHGIVAVGEDVPAAVMTTVLLERACRLQLLAMAAGPLRTWSSDAEALEKRARCWARSQIEGGWAYLVRKASPAWAEASPAQTR
ncbi:MAG TPA: class II aldolase/adducin family protein [Acidimicrobiales bacterium]|nr:class II aldolase/adducin family protein [Acidimicrobiales bacterium]